jgi:hypothetical protein
MFTKIRIAVLSLALVALFAPVSRADGFGITLTKAFHHGAVSLGFSTGWPWFGAPEPRCAPADWVPGHYETVYRPVWVEGCAERVWIPPVYGWQVHGCGRPVRVCVREGRFEMVRHAGHYENRPSQVWIEGAWRTP